MARIVDVQMNPHSTICSYCGAGKTCNSLILEHAPSVFTEKKICQDCVRSGRHQADNDMNLSSLIGKPLGIS